MNKIILGDCLEKLKELEDGSIDLIVTDPPYNLGYAGRGKINSFDVFANDNVDEEEHNKWFTLVLKEFYRLLKDDTGLYIWIDWRNYARFYMLISGYFDIKNCIIWDKKSIGMGHRFRFQHEMCIYAEKGKATLNLKEKNVPDVWSVYRVKEKYQHPTQKPQELMERCIEYSSKEGDVVLDPFVGSGTTCVAAKDLKRKYIGIELDEKYIKITNERLSGAQDKLI